MVYYSYKYDLQAMSVITKCLKDNKKTDSYINWPAYEQLYQISQTWSDLVRSNIALDPDQIIQTLILKVDSIKYSG